MVESHEIGHPARGYYIAHQHHSLDTPANQLPATTDTFNTSDTIDTFNTSGTTDSPTQQQDYPSTFLPPQFL
jgi:hypothetical protein